MIFPNVRVSIAARFIRFLVQYLRLIEEEIYPDQMPDYVSGNGGTLSEWDQFGQSGKVDVCYIITVCWCMKSVVKCQRGRVWSVQKLKEKH